MTSRLNDKQLILGQIGPMMRVSCARGRGHHELTIEERLQLLLHAAEVHGQQICQLDKRNREGIGSCPGPTIKAFSDLCDANEDSRLRRPLVTPGDTKVERVGATDGLSSRR